MPRLSSSGAVLLVLCFLVGASAAQRPTKKKQITNDVLELIKQPRVQRELKLNRSQVSKVRRLNTKAIVDRVSQAAEERRENLRDLDRRDGNGFGTGRAFRDLTRPRTYAQVEDEQRQMTLRILAEILNSEQYQRFLQIRLQARGAEAFLDQSIQLALRLTPEQTAGVRRQLAREEATSADRLAGIVDLFNEQQQATWQKMTGAPFEAGAAAAAQPAEKPDAAGNEKQAASYLRLAQALAKKSPDKAKQWARKVIELAPNSEAAAQARQLIQELD